MAASDSIKVVCRVRPLNSKEQSNGSSFVVGFPSSTSVSLAVSSIFNAQASNGNYRVLEVNFPAIKSLNLCLS